MASRIRQNYHEDSEVLINKIVNLEFHASYTYLSMSHFFDRDDVSLPGMKHLFKELSEDKREDAEWLMKFQNKRGGKTMLQSIDSPISHSWDTVLKGLEEALSLEKRVNQALLDLHKRAADRTDPHLTEFLEDKYLDKEVDIINKLGNYITRVRRAGLTGLGEYVFDRDISS